MPLASDMGQTLPEDADSPCVKLTQLFWRSHDTMQPSQSPDAATPTKCYHLQYRADQLKMDCPPLLSKDEVQFY